MNIESLLETQEKTNSAIPTLTPGDTVRVSSKVVEGDKERTQVFQGVVIKLRSRGVGSSFTVRRVTYGVGVEKTFPTNSPRVEKVEIVRRGKVRRAKLFYLRGLSAKTSRLKERRLSPKEQELEKEEAERLKREEAEMAKAAAEAPVMEAAPEATPAAETKPQ